MDIGRLAHIHDREGIVTGIRENTLRKIPDISLFESRTPERLIAGIVAGLTIGIDGGDWGCWVGGFGICAGEV